MFYGWINNFGSFSKDRFFRETTLFSIGTAIQRNMTLLAVLSHEIITSSKLYYKK